MVPRVWEGGKDDGEGETQKYMHVQHFNSMQYIVINFVIFTLFHTSN